MKEQDIVKMLELMEISFRDLEKALPDKPKLVRKPFGKVYRFEEQDIHQAIIQKLAHAQSTVRAAQVLLEHGYVQEQAALQRVVDEANEDILFLVCAVINNEITDLHKKFLDAFWQEEFDDSGDPLTSEQKRPIVPRKKIRAYIVNNINGFPLDQYRGIELFRTIDKAYSGFIHGASPHIMDRYGGDPPKFAIKGMLGTRRIEEHKQDLWIYMYRTLLSHMYVAIAFRVEHLVRNADEAHKSF